MTGPTHILIGLASVVALGDVNIARPSSIQLLTLILGAIAPDIDGDGTIARPGTILGRFVPRGPRLILDQLGIVLSRILHLLFGHRGLLHAPIVPIIIYGCAEVYDLGWLKWFALGYATHLAADFLTKGGVPLLSPASAKRFSGLPIRTGSWLEALIASLLTIFIIWGGFELLPDGMKGSLQELNHLLK